MICAVSPCHDADHERFNIARKVKGENPLGIWFKEQHVMKVHHCSAKIHGISRDETNIFHAFGDRKWMIRLILASGMAHRFRLVKNDKNVMDAGSLIWRMKHID
jgi:hypothetical protein